MMGKIQHKMRVKGGAQRSVVGPWLPLLLCLALLQSGCDRQSWNNPYPAGEGESNILYSSFSERPKHLDPVRSYSSNEYAFIGQIYEPPLQYHFLKRPYELIPLTAVEMPRVRFYDVAGNPLPGDARADEIAVSEYEIRLQPGIRYQPHPAFARDEAGRYRYHELSLAFMEGVNTLDDFPAAGSRELTAEDYVYQIKRIAFSPLHSPIGGVMKEYIIGMTEYGKTLDRAYAQRRKVLI